MTIEWYRDLVIIISGTVLIGVLILTAILALSLYARLRRILDSLQAASAGIERVVKVFSEGVIEPLTRIAGLIQGIYHGVCSAFKFSKGGKGNE